MPVDKEAFYSLIDPQLLTAGGESQHVAFRNRAVVVVSYCCGLWFPEIAALAPEDWTVGQDHLHVRNGAAAGGRVSSVARPRVVPVSPAACWAIDTYVASLAGGAGTLSRLFVFPEELADPGRALKDMVQKLARRFAAGGGASFGPGDLRATFELFVRKGDRKDGMADYLVGSAPGSVSRDLYSEEAPPLRDLARLLQEVHPVFEDDLIWRRRASAA